MTCKECSWCYKTEEDDYPCCQWDKWNDESWFNVAPCEIEEEYEERPFDCDLE